MAIKTTRGIDGETYQSYTGVHAVLHGLGCLSILAVIAGLWIAIVAFMAPMS